ncbi:putative D-aminoacylase [Fusarium austroafricanum]|uniref:Putative D-aminoacylase n=1 Tax=Fusarium austroafricanum TaxID=2364996 RepID=A0A8H4NWD8_9HYPO|nr:putative D-aminoacylase [Fusarium austroafricanum]
MKYINNRPLIRPFRAQFEYNNLHYELAGHVIEHISGQSYSDFLQTRLLEPLGMERTSFRTPSKNVEGVTVPYNALDNASTVPINFLWMGDNGYGAASGGARSSVKDLVRLYRSFLEGFSEQLYQGSATSGHSTLKQLNHIMSGKIPFDQPSAHEASYAFGWGRVQLLGRLRQIGINPALLLNGMPLVGKGTSSLVLFHQGSLSGSLTFVALLPDIEAIIVVLTNSLGLNDAADWIGQLIIEELVGVPSHLKNDFVHLAEAAVAKNLKCAYWDNLGIYKIDVSLVDGRLYWLIQGLETERFQLDHYHEDTFTWLKPRNELASRGRWVGSGQDATFWKVKFETDDSGEVN